MALSHTTAGAKPFFSAKLLSAPLGIAAPPARFARMSDIFERVEKEYAELSESVGQKISALSQGPAADDRAANIATAKAELTQASRAAFLWALAPYVRPVSTSTSARHPLQADELLQQMELEARSVPAKDRPRLQTRLKAYKADVGNLRKEIKEAEAVRQREQLMSGGRRCARDPSRSRVRRLQERDVCP